jgi:hypothetical protein
VLAVDLIIMDVEDSQCLQTQFKIVQSPLAHCPCQVDRGTLRNQLLLLYCPYCTTTTYQDEPKYIAAVAVVLRRTTCWR